MINEDYTSFPCSLPSVIFHKLTWYQFGNILFRSRFLSYASWSTMAQPNQNPPDHLLNPANPLYLHAGENPALVLVSSPLTENTFHQWQREMMVALETKNKERFVNGSLSRPPISDPLHDAWRRCNRMVMAWLTRSMSASIKQSVMWMDTSLDIWIDFKERFSHPDKFRVADLKEFFRF